MTAESGATTSRLLNRLAYALFNKATELTSVATDDRIIVADTSADGEAKYMLPGALLGGPGLTEVVTATNVLTAAESGKTFFFDALAGFLTTFPAPALGLRYKFIVKTGPTTNGYTFAPNGGTADIIVVSVNELETDTTEDGPSDDNADLVTWVANLALPGDYFDVYCDGTLWYMLGQSRLDGAVTTATT